MDKNDITQAKINNICKKYKIGDVVTVKYKKGKCEEDSDVPRRIRGIVTERYPYHLIVKMKDKVDSISYVDIVTEESLEHRRGRKRKELAG